MLYIFGYSPVNELAENSRPNFFALIATLKVLNLLAPKGDLMCAR
ncbi:MAG: hypothetical protein ACI825_000546 [Planctomycetota bacterium]|jgi:hypothetical protein